jgi:hypothetical protein
MKVIFRITKEILSQINSDLTRPHPFALERVGFIFVRLGTIIDGHLLLASGYQSVRDEHYARAKKGDYTGAIINRYAITEAMQRALSTGEGVFHVHIHDFGINSAAFSKVDMKSLNELMPSFYSVSNNALHGALLLTPEKIIGKYWTKDKNQYNISNISVVGYPSFYQKA